MAPQRPKASPALPLSALTLLSVARLAGPACRSANAAFHRPRAGSVMPTEIEAKMKIADPAAVRAALREHHAEHIGDHLETDTFLDTEDRSLLAADQGLRVRIMRDTTSGDEQYILTYKGPRQHGQVKSRDEQELQVGDPAAAMTLLERLGFAAILTFQKRRQSWRLGGCKVELDELPFLGWFAEVEGPSEEAVQQVRRMLNLADTPHLSASYIALLMSHLQEHGNTERTITFPDSP
jgi:adenylate cyclase class 2